MQPIEMTGVIERRLLVNWRAEPGAVAPLLPDGFRPQLVDGSAVVGICAVRLTELRPRGLPAAVGVTVEGAAHRVAVETEAGAGVYVLRRDTSSRLAAAVGGRLFPGPQTRMPFAVDDQPTSWRVAFGETELGGELTEDAGSSLFGDLAAASAFFRDHPMGWSPGRAGLDGLEIVTTGWSFEPVRMVQARSSWDALGAQLDSAYVMRQVPVTWKPIAA